MFNVPMVLAVLAIAWFGGSVLMNDSRLRRFRWIGLSILLFTGALLFWSQPLRLYYSEFFRAKVLLLVLIALFACLPTRFARLGFWVSLVLWAGAITAGRLLAYPYFR